MSSDFDLFVDPWIPVTLQSGRSQLASVSQCLEDGAIAALAGSPLIRLAVMRLLIASATIRDRSGLRMPLYDGFLQANVPVKAPRLAYDLVNLIDSGNMALVQGDRMDDSDAMTAQGLVIAYFCDRPGLKTQLPDISISGACPLHMGKVCGFVRGASLPETIRLNKLRTDDEWDLCVSFERSAPSSELELLTWPWRRVRVAAPGLICVYAGLGADKTEGAIADPWVIRYATPHRKAISNAELEPLENYFGLQRPYQLESYAIALNQASPIDAWAETLTVGESIEAIAPEPLIPTDGESLTITLEAPLASWSDGPVLQHRTTGDRPTRSAILGLIGCCMGIRDLSPLESLTITVDAAEHSDRLQDFHTVRGGITYDGGSDRAIVTTRHYLQQYSATVTLYGASDLLTQIAAALRQPKWLPYLGRNACPLSRPMINTSNPKPPAFAEF